MTFKKPLLDTKTGRYRMVLNTTPTLPSKEMGWMEILEHTTFSKKISEISSLCER